MLQGIVQPSRLLVLPVALIATIPFGWTLAFYENVTVLGDGSEPGVRSVLRRASAQARLWPMQNHLLLAMVSLVGAALWLNALIVVATVPYLLKTFLGIETAFSLSGPSGVLNTTFLAVTVTLAWLALDPLMKVVYTLRCFHGEARKDGADLLAELSKLRTGAKAVALAILVLGVLRPGSSPAADPANPPTATVQSATPVTPAQIETAVKETLQQDKYAWRLPREEPKQDDSAAMAWLRAFFASIGRTLSGWAHSIFAELQKMIEWFNKHFKSRPKPAEPGSTPAFDWMGLLRWFAYALLAFAAAALGVLAVRLWRQGLPHVRAVRAEVLPARPDLNDENVTATQLPEDEWLRLAAELLNQGDLRLALRAFYLATLAHLAAREIIRITRFKSNHDYETEVQRRARGSPELRAAFSANVNTFDRAWYGLYDVTAETLAQFRSNFDRIRSC